MQAHNLRQQQRPPAPQTQSQQSQQSIPSELLQTATRMVENLTRMYQRQQDDFNAQMSQLTSQVRQSGDKTVEVLERFNQHQDAQTRQWTTLVDNVRALILTSPAPTTTILPTTVPQIKIEQPPQQINPLLDQIILRLDDIKASYRIESDRQQHEIDTALDYYKNALMTWKEHYFEIITEWFDRVADDIVKQMEFVDSYFARVGNSRGSTLLMTSRQMKDIIRQVLSSVRFVDVEPMARQCQIHIIQRLVEMAR
eukprot:GILJ01011966.1.p1 GENE.GILJ01011966.1~~GILJ01011966.1.p1  ORF type:complete len:254 (-),score=36.25 GILJ01011966.1:25-786(-)